MKYTKHSQSKEQLLYDAACKKLLSYKPILAYIMKYCIPNFQNCTIQDIANKYIEQVEISSTGVHPDDSNPNVESKFVTSKLMGLNIEYNTITEGKIFYDIRFFTITPEKEPVRLIINLEAQTTESLSYPLIMRAMYYACRLISSQKEVEFSGSHYEDIKKVYSIWICTSPYKAKENSINRYFVTEKQDYGIISEKKEFYDLLEVIIIRLHYGHNSDNELLHFLSTLFSPDISSTVKLQELSQELGFTMNHNIERTVEDMCNLSNGVLHLGFERGIKEMIFSMLSKHIEDSLIMEIAQISAEQLQSLKEEWKKTGESH